MDVHVSSFVTLEAGLRALVVTWNVNSNINKEKDAGGRYTDMAQLFGDSFYIDDSVDIVVVGLQEAIELSTSNVVGSSVGLDAAIEARVAEWHEMVVSTIGETYNFVAMSQLVGLWVRSLPTGFLCIASCASLPVHCFLCIASCASLPVHHFLCIASCASLPIFVSACESFPASRLSLHPFLLVFLCVSLCTLPASRFSPLFPLRCDCAAIAQRLRSDCTVIAQRLRSDCVAPSNQARRFCCDCPVIVQ
jgi:hypothetical protein